MPRRLQNLGAILNLQIRPSNLAFLGSLMGVKKISKKTERVKRYSYTEVEVLGRR